MAVEHKHGAAVLEADPAWVQEQIAALCNPIRRRQAQRVLFGRIAGLGLLASVWIWPSIPLAVTTLAWIVWTEAVNLQLGQDQIDSAHAVRLAYLAHDAERRQEAEVASAADTLVSKLLGAEKSPGNSA